MKKRNLFAELKQGFDELAAERQGKTTPRTKPLKLIPPIPEEEEVINRGIAADPDTRELAEDDIKYLRLLTEPVVADK